VPVVADRSDDRDPGIEAIGYAFTYRVLVGKERTNAWFTTTTSGAVLLSAP
jgi:hypothetical protein